MMSTGCGVIKNVQIDTVEQKENTQNIENKMVTWCDKHTMEESKEVLHEGKLWISSEYFNGMDHAPTTRHFCREEKEIFILEMEWNDNASVHKGKLISNSSNVSFSVSSNNKDPEVQLLDEQNKKSDNQIWFTLDGKIFLFDQVENTFIDKSQPLVDESARVVINRNQIDSFKSKLPEPCDFEKIDALHFSVNEENSLATYKNLEKGLEVSIPYNSEWGSPKYRLNPFDEEKNGISFGTINVRGEGCGAWVVTQRLTFLPAQSKDATLKRLKKESDSEKFPFVINTMQVGDKEVIEYIRDGMCGGGGTIVLGKKYNYELSDTCGPNTREDIIKSMRFVE